ncbi:prepilin peptidase-dependent protein [Orbaceae bacterium ac157xtp]
MLNYGFSLLEMLFTLLISSIILFAGLTFYPSFQLSITHVYQTYRVSEVIDQTMNSIIKDIKRAGFIANDPTTNTIKSYEINAKNNCIIIRYDSNSNGHWILESDDPQYVDVFAYRFNQNNLEYKTGANKCSGSAWEKLFDPKEIKINQFYINQIDNIFTITISASLKNKPSINYQQTYRVKNENG